jgi:hypothetical protein
MRTMSSPKPVIAVRPPPRPVDLEAFVSGPPGAQPSAANVQLPAVGGEPPARQPSTVDLPGPSRQRRRRGIVERAGGVERARLTVYLDPSDAQKLRRYCFDNGLELSDVAADAIGKLVSSL